MNGQVKANTKRQENVSCRIGTKEKIKELMALLEAEKHVPISGQTAIAVALDEALANRKA